MKPSKPARPKGFLHTVLTIACAVLCVQTQAQHLTETANGELGEQFYAFWKDNGDASMTLYEGGRYQSTWDKSTNNWFGGIGWNPGGPRVVEYSGTYLPDDGANSFLSLYGWATDPFVEYYVIESYGSWRPGTTYYGSYKSDGAIYDLYHTWRTVGGINGRQLITYHSIRRDKLEFGSVSGTITTGNHFAAWAKMGLELNNLDYMVLATEGYQSSGRSDITVSEGQPGCGVSDDMPVCCTTSSDDDRDGYGTLFTGEQCIVTEDTLGWHPPNPSDVVAAINLGGIFESVEVDGVWYEPGSYVSGGKSRGTQIKISNEEDNTLYQTSTIGEFSVDIPVPEAQYVSVELGFSELFADSKAARVFDVIIEGQTVLDNVDLFDKSGRFVPWDPAPIVVAVEDGTLNIEITPVEGDGLLNYVLVRKAVSEPLTLTSGSRGLHGDLFYQFWTASDLDNVMMVLLGDGRYTTEWHEGAAEWIGGVGWKPGGARVVDYSGTFNPAENSNAYLGINGWTTNPLIEYYIVENLVGSMTGLSTHREYIGEYQSDGAVYDLYRDRGSPSIEDGLTAYYSIRRNDPPTGEVNGTVSTGNHFHAWTSMGLPLGMFDQMIFATGASDGSGRSDLVVHEGLPSCGHTGNGPICCSISADADGDGYGEQFEGQSCVVTDETLGHHPDNPEHIIAAINVGAHGEAVVDNDVWYEANRFVRGAVSRATKDTIENSDNAIHRSAGIGNIAIDIPVPENGFVSIELGFVELLLENANNARQFDVVVEGETVLRDVNVFEAAGHDRLWSPAPILAEVVDGTLNIELSSTSRNAIVSSVLVTTTSAPETSSSAASSSQSPETGSVSGGSLTNNTVWLLLVTGLAWRARRRRGSLKTVRCTATATNHH